MALQVNANELTVADLNAATLGGKVGIANMLREFSQSLTLGADLPIRMASEKNRDVGTFDEPWEYNKNSGYTDLDSGEKVSKTGSYSRVDIMGMRSSAIQYRIKQKMFMGPQFMDLVNWQMANRLKAIGLDDEHDLFYADMRQDKRTYFGLYPRFSMLTDEDGIVLAGTNVGKKNPYVTLSAGGTTSGKVSSLWIIIPGANDGVCRIYPNGTDFTGAVQFDEGDWETIEENGEATRKKTDLFYLSNGLAIMDRRSVVRIANVDVSSAENIKNLERAIYKAFTVIPQDKAGRARIYVSPKIVPDLKMYYSDKVNAATYEGGKPHNITGDFEISGVGVFRPCLHLLNTEDTVA